MTLLIVEGFEDRSSIAQLLGRWNSFDANSLGGTHLRYGAWGVEWNVVWPGATKQLAVADEHATLIAGGAWRANMGSLAAGRKIAFRSDSGATVHITIYVDALGRVAVYRGDLTTLLGQTADPIFVPNVWRHMAVKVVLHDTTGSVEIRIDGNTTPVLNLTGIDTKNAGTKAVFDNIAFGGQGSYWSGDDLYVANGAGAINNDFLGDCAVIGLFPTGNGTASQMLGSDANSVDNYLLVDEVPPNTTDYVGSATDNQQDTYAMGNLPGNAVTVHGISVNTSAAKSDAGAKSFAVVTRSAAVDYASADRTLSTSYINQSLVSETDPATSAKWTPANLDAAEFGFRVRP